MLHMTDMWRHQYHCVWSKVLYTCPRLLGFLAQESFAFSCLCMSGHAGMKLRSTWPFMSVSCIRPQTCFVKNQMLGMLQNVYIKMYNQMFYRTVEQCEDYLHGKFGGVGSAIWTGLVWTHLSSEEPMPLHYHHCECSNYWRSSGVNKSLRLTLPALWQIEQMLIIHPSARRWNSPGLRLLAGGISPYWRRKAGVSPVNRLTPQPRCQLFSHSMGSSRESRGYPHTQRRAARIGCRSFSILPSEFLWVFLRTEDILSGHHAFTGCLRVQTWFEGQGWCWACVCLTTYPITLAQCCDLLILGHTHMTSTSRSHFRL